MYEIFFVEYLKVNKQINSKLPKLIQVMQEHIKELPEDSDVLKYFKWFYELLICGEDYTIRENSKVRGLVNHFEYSDGTKIPDIDAFEIERLDFYDQCVVREDSLLVKIRLLNYLYDKSNKRFSYAKDLCSCLKQSYELSVESLRHLQILYRLIDISVRLNLDEYIVFSRQSILIKIRGFKESSKYEFPQIFFSLLLKVCVIKNNLLIPKEEVAEVIEIIKDSIENCEYSHISESCAWSLYEWYKNTNQGKEVIDALLIQIGEIYEYEAEHQSRTEGISHHIMASFYEKAIEHYIKFGIRSRIHDLKVRIKKAYKQGKLEVPEHNFNFQYYNELLKREIEQFSSGDVKKDVKRFASFLNALIKADVDTLFPSLESSYENARIRLLKNPIWQTVGISKVHEGRKIYEGNDYDGQLKIFAYDDYDIRLKLMLAVFFDNVWNKLIEAGLTVEVLMDILSEWDYFEDKDKKIIEVGLSRLFERDYISAIHTLTPRFENVFREFFACGGYSTTSIKHGTTQHEQTFNDFLLNSYVKEQLPPKLHKLIEFVMVDNLGWNLRNNIAHGISELEAFNSTTSNMIVVLYLLMTQYYWQEGASGLVINS